jgi:hypothetical protein
MAMGITAINIRNQFRGHVKEIIRGSVVSEIDVQTPFGIVTSVITTRSVDVAIRRRFCAVAARCYVGGQRQKARLE